MDGCLTREFLQSTYWRLWKERPSLQYPILLPRTKSSRTFFIHNHHSPLTKPWCIFENKSLPVLFFLLFTTNEFNATVSRSRKPSNTWANYKKHTTMDLISLLRQRRGNGRYQINETSSAVFNGWGGSGANSGGPLNLCFAVPSPSRCGRLRNNKSPLLLSVENQPESCRDLPTARAGSGQSLLERLS